MTSCLCHESNCYEGGAWSYRGLHIFPQTLCPTSILDLSSSFQVVNYLFPLPLAGSIAVMSGLKMFFCPLILINWQIGVPILFLTYMVFLVIYRLKFHPLAKFPGPWLAKVTELYPLYHAVIGDRHITFWKLHKKHGDIVRYGPNQLSIDTSTGLKEIYGHKANVKKSDWYSVFPPVKGAWSVWTCIDKAIHARKRSVPLRDQSRSLS